jgi:hypothetical protein
MSKNHYENITEAEVAIDDDSCDYYHRMSALGVNDDLP